MTQSNATPRAIHHGTMAPPAVRNSRRSIGTSNMHGVLDQRITDIRTIRQKCDRERATLESHQPLLSHMESNTRLPAAMQQMASDNAAETTEATESTLRLISEIDAWLGRAEIFQNTLRNAPPSYAGSHHAQQQFTDLSDGYDRIVLGRGFVPNHLQLRSNTDLLDCQNAYAPVVSSDALPTLARTSEEGWAAGPAAIAGYFAMGRPIGGNLNFRHLDFPERGCVEIQAFVPVACTSTESDSSLLGAAALGLSYAIDMGHGVDLFNAFGSALAPHFQRPNDAAWQGYIARFLDHANDTVPWATLHFVGKIRSAAPGTAITLNGATDPAQFRNFADQPQQAQWEIWSYGDAQVRPPNYACLTGLHAHHNTNLLLQEMGAFGASSSATTDQREPWMRTGIGADGMAQATMPAH